MDEDRFHRAIAAIDAANAADPKRVVEAGLVIAWVMRLRPDAGEALLLAARAHHIERWVIARDNYPAGRSGYLDWRRALQQHHAARLREILTAVGYEEEIIAHAAELVQKRDLWRDPDVQTLEDALCLVFLETQFAELAARLDEAKMVEVLRKTLRKMSGRAKEEAALLPLDDLGRALLGKAQLLG